MAIERIGIVGLGIMGKPIANNLLQAGYQLGLFARNPKTLETFSNAKSEIFSSPAELAQHCDVTVTCVARQPRRCGDTHWR